MRQIIRKMTLNKTQKQPLYSFELLSLIQIGLKVPSPKKQLEKKMIQTNTHTCLKLSIIPLHVQMMHIMNNLSYWSVLVFLQIHELGSFRSSGLKDPENN